MSEHGSVVGTAVVQIIPSFAGGSKAIARQMDGPITKAGDQTADKVGKRMGSRIGGALKGGIAPAIAGLAVGAVFKDAINSASDLEESGTKLNQLFGKDGAAAIQQFSDTAAKSLGQSKVAVLEAAGTFGVFAKSAGKTGKDAAAFSTDMTTLATDLASFNNTSPEEAVNALSSALRGETEPMRKYGVLMDDASMRQKALSMGLIKTTKEALTPQQKVLAAQALIMEQTSDAQGDFAKTSGGLANQQRILSAQWSDMKAKLGSKLLPVITTAVTALNNKLFPAFSKISEGAKGLFNILFKGDFTKGFAKAFNLEEDSGIVDTLFDIREAAIPIFNKVKDAAIAAFGYFKSDVLPNLKLFGKFLWENKKAVAAVAGAIAGVMVIKKVITAFKALKLLMVANPFGVAMVAITAIVYGLTHLYRTNDKARAIMQKAWAVIKSAVSAVANWFVTTALPAIRTALTKLGQGAMWLWNKAIKPAFSAIGTIVGWLWRVIVRPYLGFALAYFKTVFGFLKNVAWPVVRFAINAIGSVIKFLWSNVVKPVLGFIWSRFKSVFGWIRDVAWPIVKKAFGSIGSTISNVWKNHVKPNLDRMRSAVGKVKTAFTNAKTAIGKAWGGLTDAIKRPITAALSWIDKNFLSKVRSILRKVGADSLADKLTFGIIRSSGGPKTVGGRSGLQRASGGYIPGHSPTTKADNIPAWLTAGEFVTKVTSVRRMEKQHPGALEYINRFGELPRYAIGGKVGGLNPEFQKRLAQFNKAAGGKYSVISGLRTRAEQQRLYNLYLSGRGNLAARPGTSNHESGNAADLSPSNARDAHGALARKFGLHFPVPGEAWHVEMIGGGKGGVGSWLSGLAGKVFEKGKQALTGLLDKVPSGMWMQAGAGAMKQASQAIYNRFMGYANTFGAGDGAGPKGAGGAGVERWRGTVLKALRIVGQPASLANATLRRMNQESSGNPRAINNWDINARNGDPSKGLMQVIGQTFRAYAHPNHNKSIYDPLSNILASMRYALSRYGSLSSAYNRAGGYADGGMVKPLLFDSGGYLPTGVSLVSNQTGRPEPLKRLNGGGDGTQLVAYIENPFKPGDYRQAIVEVVEEENGYGSTLRRMK